MGEVLSVPMKIVWVPVLMILFQALLFLNGDLTGGLANKRVEEARLWVIKNRCGSKQSIFIWIAYWIRVGFYSPYIWPVQFFFANIFVIFLLVATF